MENKNVNHYEQTVKRFEKKNLTVEQIAELLSSMDEFSRESIHISALNLEKTYLADKIVAAMDLITQKRVEKYIKLVDEGNHEGYLKTMSLTDKISLSVDVEIYLEAENELISEENEKYCDILNNSIKNHRETQMREEFIITGEHRLLKTGMVKPRPLGGRH